VTSRSRPDWVGEVVDAARVDDGHVSVRWQSPSGIRLQPVDESVGTLRLFDERTVGQR
jgi:hypothetical protein